MTDTLHTRLIAACAKHGVNPEDTGDDWFSYVGLAVALIEALPHREAFMNWEHDQTWYWRVARQNGTGFGSLIECAVELGERIEAKANVRMVARSLVKHYPGALDTVRIDLCGRATSGENTSAVRSQDRQGKRARNKGRRG